MIPSVPTRLQGAAQDPEQVELLVDFDVPTSSDERQPEVPLAVLTRQRQPGFLQVLVEVLHLVGFLCKRSVRYCGETEPLHPGYLFLWRMTRPQLVQMFTRIGRLFVFIDVDQRDRRRSTCRPGETLAVGRLSSS